MLFLLRQIRRKLLTDNKVTTYLLYAFGEIVLVVVGILIAVNIDNWNQNRQVEGLANAYLTNVQRDLLTDIRAIDQQLSYYAGRDSLIHLYLKADPTKVEHYQNVQSLSMLAVIMQYAPMTPLTNGYNQLIGLDNQLDAQYMELIEFLKPLYNRAFENVDFVNGIFKKNMQAEYEQLTNKNWYSELLIRQDSGNLVPPYPFVHHQLTDPMHRNRIAGYHRHIIADFRAFSLGYQLMAKRCYLEIAQFLSQEIIPDEIDITSIDPDLFSRRLGRYSNDSGASIEITIQGDKVCIKGKDRGYELYQLDTNVWVGLGPSPSHDYRRITFLDEDRIQTGTFNNHLQFYQKSMD